jgi:hypothetical protein
VIALMIGSVAAEEAEFQATRLADTQTTPSGEPATPTPPSTEPETSSPVHLGQPVRYEGFDSS